MKMRELFDVMLVAWTVRLQCFENDLDFVAFSNDPIFDPYLNREVLHISKSDWIEGSCHYEINIIIK